MTATTATTAPTPPRSPAPKAAMRRRLHGLCTTLLDKIEDTFDVLAPLPLDDPRSAVPPPVLRAASDLMALWQACPHEACRRARRCRRKPERCVMRDAPRVPAGVRDGARLLLRGRRIGLTYEEARALAPCDVAAVEHWLRDARAMPTPKRRTRGAPLVRRKG